MAAKVVSDHPDCPSGRPYAVVGPDGEVEGCHPTEEAAQAQVDAENSDTGEGPMGAGSSALAAEADAPTSVPFAAVLCIEGEQTGDGRLIADGALSWRDLPLPLMFQDQTPEGGMMGNPHGGADFAGDILTIAREGSRIVATGTLDLGRAAGAELHRLLDNGSSLRGVSVDLDSVTAEYVDGAGNLLDELPEDALLELDPSEVVLRFTAGRIMGATVTPFPAIAGGASITLVREEDALAASGARTVEAPPAAWYEDPGFSAPTPITITADGRLFGHIALWGVAHIGFDGRQVFAPGSPSGYSYFATGAVEARCGSCPSGALESVPVGTITLGGGHASTAPGVSLAAAKRHYDDVGLAAAFVGIGEDAFGIWVAGTLAPGISDSDVALLRASSLSGDWRVPPGGTGLELVALCAVNVPGFPVPRSRVHVTEASALALAASGARLRHPSMPDALAALEARIARLESIAAPLAPLAAAAYEDSLASPRDPARVLRAFARRRRQG